jgi:cytoskeletal protein RodZ
MISVKSKLKAEREKKGVTLEQIASDTRISLRHLKSIEEGRYDDLPGGLYNRAFLRKYCEFIHLDPDEILERYEQETAPSSGRHSKAGSKVRKGALAFKISPVFMWSLMLLISATGIFMGRKWIAEIFSPYFSHSSSSGDQYQSLTAPLPEFPEHFDNSVSESSDSTRRSLVSVESPAQSTAISNHEGGTASSNAPLPLIHMELAATEQCWVVIERDGTPAVRKLLEPGEVESLGAVEKLFILLGNAGGVHLKINGMPAKQLGKTGEVLRLLITEKNIPNLLGQPAG